MKGLSIEEIIIDVGGQAEGNSVPSSLSLKPQGVSIDSRTLQRGQVFFALKGERFDGHQFVPQALKKGASAAVVRRDYPKLAESDGLLVRVDDPLLALQRLAASYRRRFPIPFVAITGTNGKTTTKDMTAEILSTRFRVLKTEGNLNNHIGLPLTLLRLSPQHEFGVVELGASSPGEIGRLAELAAPEAGLITNIGPAHLQGFGTIQQIAHSKAELIKYLNNSGPVVLNMDDPYLQAISSEVKGRFVGFGIKARTDLQAEVLCWDQNGCGRIKVKGTEIQLKAPGLHNIYNSLGAIVIAGLWGVPLQECKRVIEDFRPPALRCQMLDKGGVKFINDTYNANPDSTKAALKLLISLEVKPQGRRIAVLGDMLELGEHGPQAHEQIGQYVAESSIDYLLTVGELSKLASHKADSLGMTGKTRHFQDNQEVSQWLSQFLREGDVILIKGSRKLRMEEIVENMDCGRCR